MEDLVNGLTLEGHCPRKGHISSVFKIGQEKDNWDRKDGSCSYCGSLHPDKLMERLEKGDVLITPTDKNYKIYVRNNGGEPFLQTYRDCYTQGAGQTCKGPKECTHWITREISETKFYFQHLSETQMKRFIELLNQRRVHLNAPGHFYVTPFFIQTTPGKVV